MPKPAFIEAIGTIMKGGAKKLDGDAFHKRIQDAINKTWTRQLEDEVIAEVVEEVVRETVRRQAAAIIDKALQDEQ